MKACEVYAIRYAMADRQKFDNFMFRQGEDAPMPMDFYIWVIRSGAETILVDTGFNRNTAKDRKRSLIQCPIDALENLGATAAEVKQVILTHMHYDHAGNIDKLPSALFHVQESEVEYSTGKCMCHAPLRGAYSVNDVVNLVRCTYQDRVVFHNKRSKIAENIELVHIGGHTKGLQVVRVYTQRGWIVLASDTMHYYDNWKLHNPFPIAYSISDMLEGHRLVRRLADSDDHVIPGHDPAVLQCYPRHSAHDENIVCLHLPPTHPSP